MQDIPAIAAVAHARDICVHRWTTPGRRRCSFPPIAHGVDIAIEAGTKYLSGHSDLLLGLVTANAEWFPRLASHGGPNGDSRRARGRFSRAARLAHDGLEAARSRAAGRSPSPSGCKTRPEVLRVIHPALPEDPGYAIWKRDFLGSSGLFSLVLQPAPAEAVAALIDSLALFGLGASWGGYESLIIPFDCTNYRTATRWAPGGPTIRALGRPRRPR